MPTSTIEFADSGAVTTFESGEQAPHTAASSIAEFRQRLARRLSRSNRLSRRRGSNSASSHHKRSSVADSFASSSIDAATITAASDSNGKVQALSVVSSSFEAATASAALSSDVDCEATLTKGLSLLHMRETSGSLEVPLFVSGKSSATGSSESNDSGSRLLSESIDCLLAKRLFGSVDDNYVDKSATERQQIVVGTDSKLESQTLSASPSMASLSTSASSSITLSGAESPEIRSAAQLQGALGGSGFSVESGNTSDSEIMDYEDFMYLSACENHRHRLMRSTSGDRDAPALLVTAAADRTKSAISGNFDDDARKWWPRCVMPVQNMQYMPKLSLMFAGERRGAKLMGDRHHSSESIPLQWLQPDSPRLLRARSEGAIGKVASASAGNIDDALGYAAASGERRMDFWDVLGRCPMRPTSSLALASLKDMAKSCAGACGYAGSDRKPNSENRGAVDDGYMASSLADSASDSDDDSDSDNESAGPAYGMLLGLSTKQSPLSAMQRGNGAQQRGNNNNRNKAKRVLSEPMQYILYNSYLRYYGRPGEAQ
ncbi:hypothetical protein GGH95_001186 [Coemansia sp. RSA 1836]|nr:hypothetical protein GGH95_001186 [Coemansia sp. RSA 1836]